MENTPQNKTAIGRVGEHLVCADLSKKGFVAIMAAEGLPYDLIIDTGEKLLKCQVKATLKPSPQGIDNLLYQFRLTFNKNTYPLINDVQVYALVCIDTNEVGYVLNEENTSCLRYRDDSIKGSYRNEKTQQNFREAMHLTKLKYSITEIATKLNISRGQVKKFREKSYKPKAEQYKYFSEIIREKSWFL